MIAPCELCGKERILYRLAGSNTFACAACRRDEAGAVVLDVPATDKFSNQHRTRRNAYPGERRGPLTNTQKARVCILAAEAYAKMHGRLPSPAELDDWRRGQQAKACGFESLTRCLQEHMPALEAHFLDLKGESGKAFQKLMNPEMGERRKVLGVLRGNLRDFGLKESYAVTICRSMNKCELSEASVRQLWHVVMTMRKNQQRKARGGGARK